ncbi:MAG TPA: FAD-dependent oxidoreductase [Bryobacteraceae bacterium]|jgi:thioredoxin reductase (NADPH)|nr:FAD-dependent oxidoreductase [Bryobacteraceae bacterium]
MAIKPLVLAVDDDVPVLRAVERDLRKRYGQNYRVLSAASGQAALDLLRRIDQRNEPVALFLVDHRMPQMTGIEFLAQALERHGDSKRVLLTAYADTDAAIRAINQIKLHHYLLKPWDPPEQNLYPVLDDLLEDWRSAFRPPFEGLRVMGSRWSPKTYELREFLAKNAVPYQWLDVDTAATDPEVRRLVETAQDAGCRFPVVMFQDGAMVHQPGQAELAERIGLRTRANNKFYDLVIVGGGPAGLAAAVYGASEGLSTVIVERDAPGGQAGLSSRIENYLGFPSGLSGADLTRRAVAQARRFGAEILAPQHTVSVRSEGQYRIVKLADDSELSCHALMVATGVQWRKLDIPGMARLQGAGVYYGAGPAEAISCRDEEVYIVGGANSAGQAAMNFSRYARRVVMLVRGPGLGTSMSRYLIDEIAHTPKIEVQTGARLAEVHGETRLEAISIRCDATGSIDRVPASALFIFIGAEPSTEWLNGFVERDERGFLLTGQDLLKNGERPRGWQLDRDPGLLETSVAGVFAVGDVRHGSVKRVASGVGEGSIAIQFVHQYLAKVSA